MIFREFFETRVIVQFPPKSLIYDEKDEGFKCNMRHSSFFAGPSETH